MNERRTVNVTQACAIAAVSRSTIYNWLKAKKIEYRRTAGGNVRIFEDTLVVDSDPSIESGASRDRKRKSGATLRRHSLMSRSQHDILTGRIMALAVAAEKQGRQQMSELLTDAAETIEWQQSRWERRKPVRPIPRGEADILQAAKVLGALGGKVGGLARAAKLSPERRREIAQLAAQKRWHKG